MLYKTKTPLGKDGKPLKQSDKGVVGYRESLQLAYNANHELTQSIKIHQQGADITTQTTTYQYDAFGRRITKQSTVKKASIVYPSHIKVLKNAQQTEKAEYQHIHYLWDGNRQRQEHTDTHVFTTIYEQDSFAPVARLVWLQKGLTKAANDEPDKTDDYLYEDERDKPKTGIEVYHYHNDHLGTPNELSDSQGEVIWLADYEAWGNTAKVVWHEQKLEQMQVAKEDLQPLRFQGQYYDEETGLHYNRFRYFDPDMGMFTTRDPIGLMGGSNVFQYAPNPVGWIDPWGLSKCNSIEKLPDDMAGTFAGGRYTSRVLDEDIILHRAGVEGKPLGQYFSKDKPISEIQTRIDKGVLPRWPDGGQSPMNTVFTLKIPKGTTVHTGKVGSQGGHYVGGTQQIVVQKPWLIDGVEVLSSAPLK